jgi:hypothetical protein
VADRFATDLTEAVATRGENRGIEAGYGGVVE